MFKGYLSDYGVFFELSETRRDPEDATSRQSSVTIRIVDTARNKIILDLIQNIDKITSIYNGHAPRIAKSAPGHKIFLYLAMCYMCRWFCLVNVGVDTSAIPCDVVGVDEGEESLWEGEGVADEGGEFAVRRLARQDIQILAQL